MVKVSYFEIENEKLKMHDVDFVLDDGYLGDNTTEFNVISEQEMNSKILKFMKRYDCTIESVGNSISVKRIFNA